MTDVRRIARNAGWLLAGRLLGQGLMVLCTVVLVGRLGLAGFGGYAFLAAVVFMANVVTTFGTDMVLIRDIAATGQAGRWPAALAIQAILSVLAIALIWVGAPFVPGQGPDVTTALRLYALSLIPAAVFSVSSAGLRGAVRMRSYAAVGAAGAAIQLGAVWLLLPSGASLTDVALVLLVVQVVVAGLSWAVCAARVPGFRHVRGVARSDIAEMARSSVRIGILGFLGVLYQRAGVLALALFAGPAATGWFAAASRVVEAARVGHVSWFGALYPEIAGANGPDAARRGSPGGTGLRSAWRVSVVSAAVISTGLLVLSPVAIGLLYGRAFEPSVAALGILALSVVPSTVATHRSLELVAAGREAHMLKALLASLVVLVALLAALLPVAGLLGACWAILGAEIFQAGALLAVRRGSGAAAAPHVRPLPASG